jgi:folate-binding protein YgfZ
MSHPSWSDFLTQQGVDLDAAAPAITEPTSTWLMPLSDQTLIGLEGPDTEKFLQGQLSCNLDHLSPQRSQLGANCTPKGMVIGAFRLLQQAPGSVLLRLPQTVLEPALANLKKYSVFSKTELSRTDDQWVGLGLIGQHAGELLNQLEINAPTEINQQSLSQQVIVVRVAGEQPRFEIWCPAADAQALWQQLAPHCSLSNGRLWQIAEIKAGLVQLSPDSIESYIPQMLNLQAVEGISFDKGCYTGQEVVARLQFRGKLKKLMYAAAIDADSLGAEPAHPGSTLFTSKGRSVGKVLSCVREGEGNQGAVILQVVINKSAADDNDLHLHSADGAAVNLLPLPYTIEPELFERPQR